MTTKANREKIAMIEEAQNKLHEALDLVRKAIEDLDNSVFYEAYILDHLRIMIDADHDFMSCDPNLDDIIDSLRNEASDEEDEEEEMPEEIVA